MLCSALAAGPAAWERTCRRADGALHSWCSLVLMVCFWVQLARVFGLVGPDRTNQTPQPSPSQVCHELTVLERLHKAPEFSPAATQEALTKRPLRLC